MKPILPFGIGPVDSRIATVLPIFPVTRENSRRTCMAVSDVIRKAFWLPDSTRGCPEAAVGNKSRGSFFLSILRDEFIVIRDQSHGEHLMCWDKAGQKGRPTAFILP
jgi:hypothetical protein